MGLFSGKSKKAHLPTVFYDDMPPEETADYHSALTYLTGLSDDDFATIYNVANVYRNADKDAARALGVENTPITFIHPPEVKISTMSVTNGSIFNQDEPEFLEDDSKKVKIDKKPKEK